MSSGVRRAGAGESALGVGREPEGAVEVGKGLRHVVVQVAWLRCHIQTGLHFKTADSLHSSYTSWVLISNATVVRQYISTLMHGQ